MGFKAGHAARDLYAMALKQNEGGLSINCLLGLLIFRSAGLAGGNPKELLMQGLPVDVEHALKGGKIR